MNLKRFWPAYLAALIIFAAVEFHSEPFQECINKSYQESADKEPPERTILRRAELLTSCTGDFFKEDGEAITAFFTLILGVATIGLWLSTKGLVRSAEVTAKRQLRAYVGICENDIRVFSVGKKIEVRLGIKNFGQTPAYDLRYWSDTTIARRDEISSFAPDKKLSGKQTLNPSDGFGIHSHTSDFLSQADFDEITADTKRFYLVGEATYRDVFGNDWATEFGFEFGGSFLIRLKRMQTSDNGDKST
jgi:hypothetical protein